MCIGDYITAQNKEQVDASMSAGKCIVKWNVSIMNTENRLHMKKNDKNSSEASYGF